MASFEDDEDYWNFKKKKCFDLWDNGSGNQLLNISRLSQQVRSDIADDSAKANFSEGSLSSLSSLESGTNSVLVTPNTSHSLTKSADVIIQPAVSDKIIKLIINADKALEPQPKGKISPEEELLILRRKVQNRWHAPPVEETLRRILLGLPFSLDGYKSLEDKTKMLDAAIEQGNGDAILAVVLFLSRTLKQSQFTRILSQRPTAANHFATHLSTRFQMSELNNLLESLGRSRQASIIQFGLVMRGIEKASTNPARIQRSLSSLRNCLASHFSSGAAEMDRPHIVNAVKLCEWQLAAEEKYKLQNSSAPSSGIIFGSSALKSLAHSCRYHWEPNKSSSSAADPLSPSALCQSLGISQRAYQWTALKVKAEEHNWEAVDGLFIAKGWLQGIRIISGSSGIPMAEVATELHSQGAPKEVVSRYINLVDGTEEKIALANRLKCYNVAIDILKSQGDRIGILELKRKLPAGSEGELYAEIILKSSGIRWKN